jgi:hypothetical protein
MGNDEGVNHVSTTGGITSRRALSALLSQVLVAFTVELDNEFERRMKKLPRPRNCLMSRWAPADQGEWR